MLYIRFKTVKTGNRQTKIESMTKKNFHKKGYSKIWSAKFCFRPPQTRRQVYAHAGQWIW